MKAKIFWAVIACAALYCASLAGRGYEQSANAEAIIAGPAGAVTLSAPITDETIYNPVWTNPDIAIVIGEPRLVDVNLVESIEVMEAETTYSTIKHRAIVTHTYEWLEKTGAL